MDQKEDLDKEIRAKVKEKLLNDETIKQKIEAEIDMDLDEIISNEVKEVLKKEVEGKAEEPENVDAYKKPLVAFRKYFRLCWQGVCRPISLVMLIAYAIIAILMLSCLIFNIEGLCLSQSILGAGAYIAYVAIAAFIISIILSFISSSSRTALVFSLLLSLPFVILLFATTIQYLGLVLIALVIFNLIIQSTRE